jgi:hypothetical protein
VICLKIASVVAAIVGVAVDDHSGLIGLSGSFPSRTSNARDITLRHDFPNATVLWSARRVSSISAERIASALVGLVVAKPNTCGGSPVSADMRCA